MASRFIARQIRSKVLPLRNAPPMVTFTFDDVPASACERVRHILEQHGARGTFYVAGRGCGTRTRTDRCARRSTSSGRCGQRTRDRLPHLFASGVRHMSLDELGLELERNQALWRKIDSKIVVRNFAYPYGDLSIRTKRYLEGCFNSCRRATPASTAESPISVRSRPGRCRMLVDRAKIAELIDATVRTGGWLIFYSHDVAEPPGHYGSFAGTARLDRRHGESGGMRSDDRCRQP